LSTPSPEAFAETIRDATLELRTALGRVIVGQQAVVDGLLTGLLAGGHVLLEGAPGLGKTLLIKALGRALTLQVSRIQFTPDLMPADILGTRSLVDGPNGPSVTFERGPVFTELLLADEINRANPRTQAALLEAMAERQVTLGGKTHPLGPPFFVMATENPIEMEGTYPLPEAQADRFMMKLDVLPPDRAALLDILEVNPTAGLAAIKPCMTADTLRAAMGHVAALPAADAVKGYLVDLMLATRPESAPAKVQRFVKLGVSPRGGQALLAAARARAAMAGRLHVTREDVRAMAPAVFRHRLLLGFAARAEGVDADAVIQTILSTV
jgi:MoxR-like ATPase